MLHNSSVFITMLIVGSAAATTGLYGLTGSTQAAQEQADAPTTNPSLVSNKAPRPGSGRRDII